MNNVTQLFPSKQMATAQEITEAFLQSLLDALAGLDKHLDSFPRSLDHVRWVANEGDPGCKGAAVVVAQLEKRVSKLKARIINK